MSTFHYTAQYLLTPQHPVTVNLVGVGGTGSYVLTALARMNQALLQLGHPGLYVTAFDGDEVTGPNVGRAAFSPFEVRTNKAVSLMTHVNATFGTAWQGVPEPYTAQSLDRRVVDIPVANITVTCVDTLAARREVRDLLRATGNASRAPFGEPFERPLYWLDFGNSQRSGQAILSTVSPIEQPHKGAVRSLPNTFQEFPYLETQADEANIPSCSMATALDSQDLFINDILGKLGVDLLLWKMFREYKLDYHGLFLNLERARMSTLPIKTKKKMT